jgi:hypothetical protein
MKKFHLLFGIPFLLSLSTASCIPRIYFNTSVDSAQAVTVNDQLQLNLAKTIFAASNQYRLRLNYEIEQPDTLGRLGRNKIYQMYSSADWQRSIWINTQNMLVTRNTVELDKILKALEFAFAYQLADGSFKFVPIPNIAVSPEQQTKEICIGGCYFFIAGFAVSANALEQSEWFQTTPAIAPYRDRLKALKPKVLLALNYLSSEPNLSTLRNRGNGATNRIWFKALAFYSGSKFVGSEKYRILGLEFANKAYSQFNPTTGIFLEEGGGDSSYQGVNLINASLFATQLPTNDPFRTKILQAVVKGANWELTKILPTGEISTEGNTRIKPGGEVFLGKQKGVNIPEVLRGLSYAAAISGNQSIWNAAQRISSYYYK